jgi:hypothetical protein
MQTMMIVDGYTYHLSEYAYVTIQGDLVGYSKSPDIRLAGEIKEIPDDCWLTPLTPVKRALLGDTFVMEGGVDTYSRHFLEQLKEEEEESLKSRNVKPGWQPFTV